MAERIAEMLARALAAREALVVRLRAEETDAYRLFHGAAEGRPGLTIDRYGALVLAQTFREPLAEDELAEIESFLRLRLGFEFAWVYNHRAENRSDRFNRWHVPKADALGEFTAREFGVKHAIRARHRGLDPWLFLDLRTGRRRLRELARGQSVLNLFAHTCAAGMCAVGAGASEVWNVDFARSSLAVGKQSLELNGWDESCMRFVHEDCLPVMRQLAGLPIKGRASSRSYAVLEPRAFDIVFLDPPAWSKSAFGAVDVARDYESLFKPALLATREGGTLIATHHVARVELALWLARLKRCATKAGRPLASVEAVTPEADFPSFDGKSPLKIAVCRVGGSPL